MRLLPMLMAALVVAALYWWIVHPQNGGAGPGAEESQALKGHAEQEAVPPVRVVAYRSEARPVASAITLRGRTEANRNVEVRAETDGLVVSEPRRAGARVARGDVLCRIERGSRNAELAEAEAALARAEADNRAAEQLSRKGYTSDIIAIARRAELEAAQALVDKVRIDIARLEMTAPFDGVLESDTAEFGALLRAGDACATVIALDPIKLVGFVPEIDVDKIAPGMEARARLISGQEVAGEIRFVSRSADPQTRTFRVEIAADNPDGSIRDGMTAEITVPLTGEDAHMIPQAALTLDDSGRLGVRIAEDGVARFVPAEIIRDEAVGVWVTGLPEQADVIMVGQEYVADGRAIAVTYADWSPEDGAHGGGAAGATLGASALVPPEAAGAAEGGAGGADE
jgi:membrane fusion protein, multidrug efflux system